MVKVELSKPQTLDEKEIKELELDLEGLTGDTLLTAEKECRLLKDDSVVLLYSNTFLAIMAAKAARVPTRFIKGLPVKDFVNVTLRVQDFLLK